MLAPCIHPPAGSADSQTAQAGWRGAVRDRGVLRRIAGETQDRMNRSTALAKPSSSLEVVTRRAAA